MGAALPEVVIQMSFLKKLFGKTTEPAKPRVRVCIECGMPIAEHKEWCAILRTQQAMDRRAGSVEPA